MEQVRNDVAYANQRVVIGAAASGISLGVAGGTHHALEDLALMRSLPNMTVIVPADVNEAYRATLATLVSSTSINVASMTVTAISQGLTSGCV